MRLVVVLLSALLALSLSLNAYFYGQLMLTELDAKEQTSSKQVIKPHAPVTLEPTAQEPSAIEVAFRQYEFNKVLALYPDLRIKAPDVAETLRQDWFETILAAIDSDSEHPYDVFIQSYLKLSPYDNEFLYLEVLNSDKQDDPTDMLLALYNLLQGDLSEELRSSILNKIRTEYQAMIKELTELGAWDILAVSLESLIAFAPEDRKLLLPLANAYAQSGQFGLMEGVLSALPPDDPQSIRLREFRDKQLATDEDVKYDSTGISLTRVGDHFIVDSLLNNRFNARLMIDTGASTTTISRELFNRMLGVERPEFIGRYNVNTANGRVRAPVFRFQSLTIGAKQLNNIAIVVLPLEELQADGLLGMNYMRNYRFLIDQEQNTLHLDEL